MVALSGELFDAIEVNAARTGNHKRAAVRMGRLAAQAKATSAGMSRAEAHMRAGEQWLLADEPEAAVEEFRIAIADAGPTFDDPRVPLARAMFALGRSAEADALLRELKESEGRSLARTCDLVAELQLLLRLRYRLRVDLGLPEDDYDRLLDDRRPGPEKPAAGA